MISRRRVAPALLAVACAFLGCGPEASGLVDAGRDVGVIIDARAEDDASAPPDARPDDGGAPHDGGSDAGALLGDEEATLLPAGSRARDMFGAAVAISADGSRVILGGGGDDVGAPDGGSARVFLRTGTTWTEEAALVVSDAAPEDGAGSAVALSADGSVALVGAPGDDTAAGANAGSVTVFIRSGTTWTEEATLLAPDGAADDAFGSSVALGGGGARALVGVRDDETAAGTYAGSARVFLRTGSVWTEEATLLAPDGERADGLGVSVSLSTDASRALVGALHDLTGTSATGSARVFVRTGTSWAQEATLLGDLADDWLGCSVALTGEGDRALVGAMMSDATGATDSGSARIFVRTGSTWAEEATLASSDPAMQELFGQSVAISADGARAVVGAHRDTTVRGAHAGSVRVFLREGTTWTEDAVRLASTGAAEDWLGFSVALSADGARAVGGSPQDAVPGAGASAGSASVFLLEGP